MKYTKIIAISFMTLAIAFVVMPKSAFADYGSDTSSDVVGSFDYPTSDYEVGGSFESSPATTDYEVGGSFESSPATSDYEVGGSFESSPATTDYEVGGSFEESNPYSLGNSTSPYAMEDSGCSSCSGGYGMSSGGGSLPSYTYSRGGYSGGTGSTVGGGSIPSFTYTSNSLRNNNSQSQSSNNNNTSNSSATSSSTSSANVNNVNNNYNNVVVNVPNSSNPTYPYPNPVSQLTGSCTISPSYNVRINQDLSFYATASGGTGGTGGYSFYWTGSDGIYSSSQSFTGRFYSFGQKYATVRITSGNQTISQTCYVNVEGYYPITSNVNIVNPVYPTSGVYLNQVPATGISANNLRVVLFSTGMILWSAFIAFVMISKRKIKLATAGADRFAEFKKLNMAKKGF